MKGPVGIFRYQEIEANKTLTVGVICVPDPKCESGIICDALDALYDLGTVPDVVTYVIYSTDIAQIRSKIGSPRIRARMRVPSNASPVRVIYLSPQGKPIGEEMELSGIKIKNLAHKVISITKTVTLTQWFRRNNGMMGPTEGFHYIKPSRKSVDKFIRTGNVLLESIELEYLCFWFVERLREDVKTIWVDSSTILSIAYAVALCRNKWLGKTNEELQFRSFESYGSFRKMPFSDGSSMAIISASSGGAMARDFIKRNYSDQDIITLFYLPSKPASRALPTGFVVCNLKKNQENPEGYDEVAMSDVDGSVFPSSSKAIPITPEGFLPYGLQVVTITIKSDYIPKWYKDLAEATVEKKVIRVNSLDQSQLINGGRPRRLTFGFDLEKIWTEFCKAHQNYGFGSLLLRYLQSKLPATLEKIIYIDDKQSEALADVIIDWFNKYVRTKAIRKISVREYVKTHRALTVSGNSSSYTLVVASSLFDLQPLLNASQLLRQTQKNHAIGYLLPLYSSQSPAKAKADKSHLTFCSSGPFYEMNSFYHCYASWIDSEATPWEKEFQFWGDLLGKKNNRREEDEIRARLKNIGDPKGCVNTVFLKSPEDQVISLRQNSAFVEGVDFVGGGRSISQADTLFMVSCALASMEDKGLFIRTPLKRVVLDPENFNRFSDGVIQASMLRLAVGGELCYAVDASASRRMSKILLDLIADPTSARSEALGEFIYALVVGNMSLKAPDEKVVKEEISKRRNRIKNVLIGRLVNYWLSGT